MSHAEPSSPRPDVRRGHRRLGLPAIRQLSIWDVGVTKWCSGCQTNKPLHDFAFHDRATGLLLNMCRPCRAKRRRDHYLQNKPAYIEWAVRQMRRKRDEHNALVHAYLRDHPCVDCGEADIALLEFDHIDEATKVKEISRLLGRDWQTVLAEIAKCDVRCVNCHRRRTAERGQWQKRLGEGEVSYNAAYAGVAQLVERQVPILKAAGSCPVSRSVFR